MTTQFDITKLIINTKAKSVNLTANEKNTLTVMSNFFNDKETSGLFTCFTSHKTLSEHSGASVATVKRAIAKLELLGYLSSRQQLDNSKVYTWLGFDEVKSEEALRHILYEEKRLASKKKLDKERGATLGRNTNQINKIKQILEGSPNCEVSKSQLKYAIEARKNNILFSNYSPYKRIFSSVNGTEPTPTFEDFVPEAPLEDYLDFETIPMTCYDYSDFEENDKEYYIE